VAQASAQGEGMGGRGKGDGLPVGAVGPGKRKCEIRPYVGPTRPKTAMTSHIQVGEDQELVWRVAQRGMEEE